MDSSYDANSPGCCVSTSQTRTMLMKALGFYFAKDYFLGTDTMILWYRKALVDLENCD